ncbi:MAG: glucose-1-phosphate cytidylyltransferase [Gemmataceae bacterium]
MTLKVVLLAGGLGTRLSEETELRPKPMIEIGGFPILVHIMGICASWGMKEFLVAAGYKSEYIKDYFSRFHMKFSDWAFRLAHGDSILLRSNLPDWQVSVVDTGLHTMTGGRIRRLAEHIGSETFLATYGDGLADIDLSELVRFHRAHGRLATVTAVRPPARFGCLDIEDGQVIRFAEKPQTEAGWINGGFFLFEPGVFDYLTDDATILEREPLTRLAEEGQLMAYRHEGYWQPMDTLREKKMLEEMWGFGAGRSLVGKGEAMLHSYAGDEYWSPGTRGSRECGSPSGLRRWAQRSLG